VCECLLRHELSRNGGDGGVVGLNGSGKTVASWARGGFEPTGDILVGGVKHCDVSVRNLRTLVTLGRRTVLFDATIPATNFLRESRRTVKLPE